jgi:F0F1-type ATP synthase assembly protein I
MLRPMEGAAREQFPPAEAGAVLVVVTLLVIAIGTLLGWAAGSVSTGLIIGVIVGLPVGIFAVYRRYRRYFA